MGSGGGNLELTQNGVYGTRYRYTPVQGAVGQTAQEFVNALVPRLVCLDGHRWTVLVRQRMVKAALRRLGSSVRKGWRRPFFLLVLDTGECRPECLCREVGEDGLSFGISWPVDAGWWTCPSVFGPAPYQLARDEKTMSGIREWMNTIPPGVVAVVTEL